jgi:hypothetical protein
MSYQRKVGGYFFPELLVNVFTKCIKGTYNGKFFETYKQISFKEFIRAVH